MREGEALALRDQGAATPAEVAHAAVWLCSDAAAFITGASLLIDGGLAAG